MKLYSGVTEEVARGINRMVEQYHPELAICTFGALFMFDDEASSEQVLTHNGYPAAAMVRITSLRDRTLGMADAVIIIDRATWLTLQGAQCEALLDHELQHLELVTDEESGKPIGDAIGRPKLTLRRHDRQLGWFDEVARRHGDASPEVRQARSMIAETGQLYFHFESHTQAQTRLMREAADMLAGRRVKLADGTDATMKVSTDAGAPADVTH